MSHKKLNYSVEEINELLNSINNNTPIKKFSPTFGINPWWVATTTEENNKKHIDKYAELGCEEIPFIVHVIYSDGIYSTSEDLERHLRLYDYILSKNMKVSLMKFHIYTGISATTILNDKATFFSAYTNILKEWCTAFAGKIEYCTVLNELGDVYNDSNNTSECLTLINEIKSLGYKVSCSFMGESDVFATPQELLNELDFLAVNIYPRISEKCENTTYEDSLIAWNARKPMFNQLAKINKNIIISETGAQHFWECLSNPGKWDWSNTTQTDGFGMPANLSIYGLLEGDIKSYILKAYYWYYDSLYYDECKELLHHYLGGAKC